MAKPFYRTTAWLICVALCGLIVFATEVFALVARITLQGIGAGYEDMLFVSGVFSYHGLVELSGHVFLGCDRKNIL
ncbi:MAG: hypothetical protein FWC50_07890 [Planctomycetaceae bacterium]|nr:hypothetical protein [Planctomycetaceae bacterium]